jgi:hypothetical protein
VTDTGAAHLTRLSELQELELVSSAITAGAMSAIKQLKQLRKLRLTEALQLLITEEVRPGLQGAVGRTLAAASLLALCCGSWPHLLIPAVWQHL